MIPIIGGALSMGNIGSYVLSKATNVNTDPAIIDAQSEEDKKLSNQEVILIVAAVLAVFGFSFLAYILYSSQKGK